MLETGYIHGIPVLASVYNRSYAADKKTTNWMNMLPTM